MTLPAQLGRGGRRRGRVRDELAFERAAHVVVEERVVRRQQVDEHMGVGKPEAAAQQPDGGAGKQIEPSGERHLSRRGPW